MRSLGASLLARIVLMGAGGGGGVSGCRTVNKGWERGWTTLLKLEERYGLGCVPSKKTG